MALAGSVTDEGELPEAFTLGQGAQPLGLDGRLFDRDLALKQNERALAGVASTDDDLVCITKAEGCNSK